MSFDIWENIPGTSLKLLFKDKRYPDNPDKTQTLPSFATPPNIGDNYGARVTAYYQVCIRIHRLVFPPLKMLRMLAQKSNIVPAIYSAEFVWLLMLNSSVFSFQRLLKLATTDSTLLRMIRHNYDLVQTIARLMQEELQE